jgi:hypothetical protein
MGLTCIEALPAPLTAHEVLKAVSAHALGLLPLNKERLASLFKLGEAHRLWGPRGKGVTGERAPKREAPGVELDEGSPFSDDN